jgi:hypothetical protein
MRIANGNAPVGSLFQTRSTFHSLRSCTGNIFRIEFARPGPVGDAMEVSSQVSMFFFKCNDRMPPPAETGLSVGTIILFDTSRTENAGAKSGLNRPKTAAAGLLVVQRSKRGSWRWLASPERRGSRNRNFGNDRNNHPGLSVLVPPNRLIGLKGPVSFGDGSCFVAQRTPSLISPVPHSLREKRDQFCQSIRSRTGPVPGGFPGHREREIGIPP